MAVDRLVDIPANAQPKGNNYSRTAEEVPKRLRFYFASIPRAWTVELYARKALCWPGTPLLTSYIRQPWVVALSPEDSFRQ